MILVTGSVRLKPGVRDAALEVARPMVEATRQEEGCHAYIYSFDAFDPDVMVFQEQWESMEALTGHLQSPHMATFMQASADLVAGAPEMTVWQGCEAQQV